MSEAATLHQERKYAIYLSYEIVETKLYKICYIKYVFLINLMNFLMDKRYELREFIVRFKLNLFI